MIESLKSELRGYIEARELLCTLERVHSDAQVIWPSRGTTMFLPELIETRQEVTNRFARLKELVK